MIKLRTMLPTIALSLSAITMASGQAKAVKIDSVPKTETIASTKKNDEFVKENKDNKNISILDIVTAIISFAGVIAGTFYAIHKYSQQPIDIDDIEF